MDKLKQPQHEPKNTTAKPKAESPVQPMPRAEDRHLLEDEVWYARLYE